MSIFVQWPITIVLFFACVFGIFYLMTRYKHIMEKICIVLLVFSVGGGGVIYCYSYLLTGWNVLLSVIRGMLTTARMFSGSADYALFSSAMGQQFLSDNVWLQIIFWVLHALTLIVFQIALISLFGRKLIEFFRLYCGAHKEVYIIKGSNKYALLLGENIATHDLPQNRPEKNRIIVFLTDKKKDEKKLYEKTAFFGGIVQVLDGNHEYLYYLQKAGLGKFRGRRKKYNIVLMPNDSSAPEEARLAAEYAKEKSVKPENLDIFVFVASEWDREKIEGITQAKKGEKRIYPYTFHVISETDLLVRQMIQKHPPFECNGLEFNNGKTDRDFTVMIIGFGTMGQSALLHLMMNGQFVGSRMRAIIIDKNIDNLHKWFLRRYPGLELCCTIDPMEFDLQCEGIYDLLEKKVSRVDYVVVALGSNEIIKQVAWDVWLHYKRNGINPPPYIAVLERNGSSHEVVKKEEKKDEKVFTFGCRKEICKESVVIREELDWMAKAVNDAYNDEKENERDKKPWHELDWFSQESNRASADFIPAMLKLAGLDKDDVIPNGLLTQDVALAEILAQTEHLRWNAFHVAMGYRPMSIKEMNQCKTRKDPVSRLHVCLVPWDKLEQVAASYNKLVQKEEEKRNFKNDDYKIIKNIPKFLSAAKG